MFYRLLPSCATCCTSQCVSSSCCPRGAQVDGFQPYTSRPVALVSTAEKGYFSVRVRVTTQGGHSSVPPIDHTSAGTLAGGWVYARGV
jgi:hypothetical protein